MRLGYKKVVLLTAVVAGATGFTGTPAYATGASAAQVSGWMTITPGVSPVPTVERFTFTGLITTTGNAVSSGNSACDANGGSTVHETTAVGKGAGTWECRAGPLAGCVGTMTYTRVVFEMTVDLAGSAGTCNNVSGTLTCLLTPSGTTVATTYFTVTCAGELHRS